MKNEMNDEIFSPDDPRLTAYALGELEGAERAAVEALLGRNAAARATVQAVRAMAGHMTAALAEEPAPAVAPPRRAADPVARAAIVQGRDLRKLDGGEYRHPGKLIRFPQFYYVLSGLAAACFVLAVVLRSPVPTGGGGQPRKVYTVVDLGPPPGPQLVQLPVADASSAGQSAETPAMPAAPAEASAMARVEMAPPAPNAPSEKPTLPLLEQIKSEALASAVLPPVPAVDRAAPPVVYGAESLAQTTQPGARNLGAVSLDGKSGGAAKAKFELVPANAVASASVKSRTAALPAPAGGAPAGKGAAPTANETIVLSAFTVSTSQDRGYAAANSMSGSRFSRQSERERRPTPPRGARFGDSSADAYAHTVDNDFLAAAQNPLSTFSIDGDTASYANLRSFIVSGRLPPRDAVRVEEMLNYFPYRYPQPKDDKPFAASLEVAEAPWAPAHRLVRIGLKGREVSTEARPAANLVFLLDVSGSMNAPNRLPLVKESMRLLVGKLRPDDRVAIVTYAGNSGLALPSTPVAQAREILDALDSLEATGSTNGAMGIHLAYDIAKANFVSDGINRVILCTDGDFNVGVTSEGELTRLIAEKAKSGVFLTVLGFGMGNLKDSTLEKLADKGNGNYGYIDTRREAEKLLVQQVNGTLLTIAKDVKIQVEFNPAKVASYRLIGYENRLLKKEDFNNDKVDAGEIGAGHTVTALYEIVPVGAEEKPEGGAPAVDDLKYQPAEIAPSRVGMATARAVPVSGELLTVKIRFKKPDGFISRKIEFSLTDHGESFADASGDFKFAAAVAGLGMILRDSPHKGTASFAQVVDWAAAGAMDDPGGWRGEFVELARTAATL